MVWVLLHLVFLSAKGKKGEKQKRKVKYSHLELHGQAAVQRGEGPGDTAEGRGRGAPFHGAGDRAPRRHPLRLAGVFALEGVMRAHPLKVNNALFLCSPRLITFIPANEAQNPRMRKSWVESTSCPVYFGGEDGGMRARELPRSCTRFS